MGLDISVYKKIDTKSFVDESTLNEEEYDDAHDKGVYLWDEYGLEQSEGLKKGFYDAEEDRELGFRAGSYSGYGFFRRLLCNFYYGISDEEFWDTYGLYKGKPFSEMINFSDCEGFIGPKTSAKLYKDFVDNKDNFYSYLDEQQFDEMSKDWYKKSYENWLKGYGSAADEGVVVFH